MQLRERKPADEVNYAEHGSEDPDSEPDAFSDEEVYVPRQKSKAAQRGKRKQAGSSVKRPELLEEALQHLEIRRYINEKSLRALRLTAKKFRELVENAGALTHFKFSKSEESSFDAYLESPRSIQRVEAIIIHFKLSIPQATKFVVQEPPALEKLVLEKTSFATEAFFCCAFPHLKSFSLSECPKIEAYNLLAKVAWPLQELALGSLKVTTDELVAILGNFPGLRKLKLLQLRHVDAAATSTLQEGLEMLETLDVSQLYSRSNNYLTMRLFHENLQLPALRTLKYNRSFCSISVDCIDYLVRQCSWVKQLRSLILRLDKYRYLSSETFTELMSVLKGGPLESLDLWHSSIFEKDWNQISLPKLTYLDLKIYVNFGSGSFFEWFSTANLPMLKEAKITIAAEDRSSRPEQLLSGISTFTASFPHLCSLSLAWCERVLVSPKVVQEILTHFLPQLEEFTLDCCSAPGEYDIADMFGVEDEAPDTGVEWPRLRKLALKLCNNDHTYPLAVMEQLASAAHHCPRLDLLEIYIPYSFEAGNDLERFASTLKESQAWPLMKNFTCRSSWTFSFLRKLWPHAKIDSRYSYF